MNLSTRSILVIVLLLFVTGGGSVRIAWNHDDDRFLEVTEEFREDLTLPFAIIATGAESHHA